MTVPSHSEPPFELTEAILELVAEICEALCILSADLPAERRDQLHRANRIRTIHASLAIEGNTLCERQVEAVHDGRKVQEVRNALVAYERSQSWDPGNIKDLCAAHTVLMTGLVDQPGVFRQGAAGLVGGEAVADIAPPADRILSLVSSLLSWLTHASVHPLVRGCVFRYEFGFIQPFIDGNGRLGRLWQMLIMSRWSPLCAVLPVENVICDRQADYHAALRKAAALGRSTAFIVFMLSAIQEALTEAIPLLTGHAGIKLAPGNHQVVLLEKCRESTALVDLMTVFGRSDRKEFRRCILNPLIEGTFIEMTIPEKPRSSKQRYRLTEKGWRWLEDRGG